jgi:hypothetical protein
MKYLGPEVYRPHVLGDVEAALRDLQKAGYRATARPAEIRVQEVRGTRNINGEYCTAYNGKWGRAWHFYRGRGLSRIELVTWPNGKANRSWRQTLRHEAMHAVMSCNGIAMNNCDEQHRIMKTMKGWY